jgi:FlaA1/EpsC-like NDP-sugar epimerase
MLKKILITGSCGTIGTGLVRYLLDFSQDFEILCFDNNENQLFYQDQEHLHNRCVSVCFGDIRDLDRLRDAMSGISTVIHAAALKHVVMCERSPMDSVQSNIIGVNNVIQAANEAGVKKVIFTSSDKAVNPTNVMGTSKLMGERLITAANANHYTGNTIFSSTRFGNVLGSSGSVIPIFRKQIEKGGPVTLTDSEMTRFVMSRKQAVELVLKSAAIAKGGEVFITKMPVIKISDLAEVMISELAPQFGFKPASIKIVEIGSKPGEKLYEELMSSEETRRTVELEDYFAVLPAFRGIYRKINYDFDSLVSEKVTNPYISQNETALNKTELRNFLLKNNLLFTSSESEPDQRYWPGDKH